MHVFVRFAGPPCERNDHCEPSHSHVSLTIAFDRSCPRNATSRDRAASYAAHAFTYWTSLERKDHASPQLGGAVARAGGAASADKAASPRVHTHAKGARDGRRASREPADGRHVIGGEDKACMRWPIGNSGDFRATKTPCEGAYSKRDGFTLGRAGTRTGK